jgi:hypothetical protein
MKNHLIIPAFIAVLLLGCSKQTETTQLNAIWSLEDEYEQIFKDSDATRVALVLEFECPEEFPGAAHMDVKMRNLKGDLIRDIIPSFSIVDAEKKRTFYFYINQSDLDKYPHSVIHATVSSNGFRPITVVHAFERTKET